MFRWCFGWANYDTPPKSRGSRLVQEPDPHHGNLREGRRPSFSLRESEYPCFFSLKFFHLVPIKPRIRPGAPLHLQSADCRKRFHSIQPWTCSKLDRLTSAKPWQHEPNKDVYSREIVGLSENRVQPQPQQNIILRENDCLTGCSISINFCHNFSNRQTNTQTNKQTNKNKTKQTKTKQTKTKQTDSNMNSYRYDTSH